MHGSFVVFTAASGTFPTRRGRVRCLVPPLLGAAPLVQLFEVHGMPPKAKAGVVAQLSGTTSNESPNLGGRPKKQKVAFEEAAKDIALGKVQTITSLLGKRNVRPADDLGGSSSSPASAAPLSTSADPALRSRKYLELYEDRFDHDSEKKNDQHFYNVLLLVAIVLSFAVDTSICERGFSLMNNLKTVRRSQMGNTLLRMLMVICSLGEEWKDPSKIPVAEIIEEWRSHSSRGRYKDNIWRPEILNDLVGSGSGASTGSGVPSVGSGEGDREEQVDAFEAGGLFRMFGRMANQDAVRARAFPPASGLPTPR